MIRFVFADEGEGEEGLMVELDRLKKLAYFEAQLERWSEEAVETYQMEDLSRPAFLDLLEMANGEIDETDLTQRAIERTKEACRRQIAYYGATDSFLPEAPSGRPCLATFRHLVANFYLHLVTDHIFILGVEGPVGRRIYPDQYEVIPNSNFDPLSLEIQEQRPSNTESIYILKYINWRVKVIDDQVILMDRVDGRPFDLSPLSLDQLIIATYQLQLPQ